MFLPSGRLDGSLRHRAERLLLESSAALSVLGVCDSSELTVPVLSRYCCVP